jgi:hypothetical protein
MPINLYHRSCFERRTVEEEDAFKKIGICISGFVADQEYRISIRINRTCAKNTKNSKRYVS